ncbi:unnamed protein product [Caenorhabditis angaria]|uniref:Amino acid transporter transmembrane domain-containing protein n=1 Tax=Caenorhabditis angaria TaxID=860376 RepID=A0A9P1IL33_9PELO|nr:unnamed protein product [Caenorhabditis angaria]
MKISDSEAKRLGSQINEKGFSWLMGAVFIVGETAGGGMIALPYAVTSTGLVGGIILLMLCALFSLYTALELSWTWKIMHNQWEEYREHCRQPYAEIAYRAIGPKSRSLIATILCLAQIGFATVLILLAAKNLSLLLHFFFSIDINQCYLILIVGIFVWPLTMLKSPMHFWQVALFSAGSSTIAVILVAIGMIHDFPTCSTDVPHNPIDLAKATMSFGTFVFAFGGHATLPTIQHDMKKPAHFIYSIFLAVFLCTIYYLTIALGGYFTYGSTVGEAVIPSIQIMWIQQIVNLMIAIHVITTIVIVLSPPIQQVEQWLKLPHDFGVKRFVVRTLIYWFVLFIALSIPHFGPLLDLFGASLFVMMTLVFPPIFYLSLRTQEIDNFEKRPTIEEIIKKTPKYILFINGIVLAFGIIGGILATITSLIKLFDEKMAAPCYIQYFSGNGLEFSGNNVGAVNCCGSNFNLTVSGISPNGFCSISEI